MVSHRLSIERNQLAIQTVIDIWSFERGCLGKKDGKFACVIRQAVTDIPSPPNRGRLIVTKSLAERLEERIKTGLTHLFINL